MSGAKKKKTAGKGKYIGCYKDCKGRDLPVRKGNGNRKTCAKSCKGYKFFGEIGLSFKILIECPTLQVDNGHTSVGVVIHMGSRARLAVASAPLPI